MAEILLEYADPVRSEDGRSYKARACGAESRGSWQAWIEFIPLDEGDPIRSGRETTQPNRQYTEYWATGLTAVYLEGALRRAQAPIVRPTAPDSALPYFDGPAEPFATGGTATEAVLDPFSVHRKGEMLLRHQLSALAGWHLVNIIRKYRLSDENDTTLTSREPAQLVELIVAEVARAQTAR